MITAPRMRKFGAGQKIKLMSVENDERISSEGSVSKSVLSQLTTLNETVKHLATKLQISDLEKSIEIWKHDMNEGMHKAIAEKVDKRMEKRHETCLLEFREIARGQREEHEQSFHKRSSQAPSKPTNWNAFFTAMIPFVKNVLPWLLTLATGGGLIAQNFNTRNTIQPVPHTSPADTVPQSEPDKNGG